MVSLEHWALGDVHTGWKSLKEKQGDTANVGDVTGRKGLKSE